MAQHILIFCVLVYRWVLSPAKTAIFGPFGRCRCTPTCSEYALEAVRIHGALAGSWLTARRLCRCHPWGGCSYDPVPRGEAEGGKQKAERTSGRFAATAAGTRS